MVEENLLSINISGLVGYTILMNPETNKLIILLGDVHDGVSYCNNTQKIWIDSILDKLLNKKEMKILLEEVPREGLELVELWPDAIHTGRLKKWFLSNQDKIVPIDIRPYLIPFSHQKYHLNMIDNYEKNIIMKQYLQTLNSLFKLNNIPLKNSIIFFKKIINALQDKTTQKGVFKMYTLLKKKYQTLIDKINLEDTFEKTITDNPIWFRNLEELKLNIMDWYTSILLLGKCHCVIHFGLAHYLNVKKILENNFKFKFIYQTGLNSLDNFDKLEACIKLL